MVKNIIFDMGGVLVKFDHDEILNKFGITGDDDTMMRTELLKSYEWVALDRGTMSFDEAYRSVCRRLPEHLHNKAYSIINGWWKPERIEIPGMAELVYELKKEGYRIYLLSNAAPSIYEYVDTLPGAECFDGRIISCDWKLMKPEHEIYEKLFSEFNLTPSECLFIDDSPANVEGAIHAGMSAVVFRGDSVRLRRELNEMGVKIQVT